MKNEKNYMGFLFEAFRRTKKLISKLFFLKSEIGVLIKVSRLLVSDFDYSIKHALCWSSESGLWCVRYKYSVYIKIYWNFEYGKNLF